MEIARSIMEPYDSGISPLSIEKEIILTSEKDLQDRLNDGTNSGIEISDSFVAMTLVRQLWKNDPKASSKAFHDVTIAYDSFRRLGTELRLGPIKKRLLRDAEAAGYDPQISTAVSKNIQQPKNDADNSTKERTFIGNITGQLNQGKSAGEAIADNATLGKYDFKRAIKLAEEGISPNELGLFDRSKSTQHLCRNFIKGNCKDDKCPYQHLPPSIKHMRKPIPENVCIRQSCMIDVCTKFHTEHINTR